MRKLTSIVFAAVILLGAGVASAQAYYPGQNYNYNYTTPSYSSFYDYNYPTANSGYVGTSCTSLSLNLTVGSRGTDVSSLQSFLVSRGYPGSGSWMITGYFGQATRAALITFQSQQGLPTTGYTDAATRAAIARVSCGNTGNSYNYNNYTTTPSYPWSNYTPTTNYYPNYPYNYGCGTSNPIAGVYTGSYAPNCVTPAISYITPTNGAVGSQVTVYGSGFSTSGNTVYFGSTVITNVGSFDGQTLSFTVPSQMTGNSSQLITLGVYNVSVANTSGMHSNSAPFTVTSLAGSSYAPTISSVSGPAAITAGTTGSWNITVNTNNSNYYNNLTVSVNWGDQNTYGYAAAPAQQLTAQNIAQTLSFTHTYMTSGTYTITFTVTSQNGQSTISSQTVSVSGNSTNYGGVPSLNYINPTVARVGTQVSLQGSGFSSYGNTVYFGGGSTLNVPSVNGTTIYFTIPTYISPCTQTAGTYCPMYMQQVTPGVYPIYVSNGNGQTSPINITITQ